MSEKIPTIGVSRFAIERHKKSRPYSHFESQSGDGWQEVIDRVKENWFNLFNKQGYKPGVYLVKVNPEGFYSATVEIIDGMELSASLYRRRSWEDPYIKVVVNCPKTPARSVYIVLYRSDVLAEDNDRSTDCDWEIVSVNASDKEFAEEPMNPLTMARNFLHLPGGTQGTYSAKEFAESIVYWSTRASCSGDE
jgi:hypothetical protein